MAFNINEIKGQLVTGGARPTLFDCIITAPAGVGLALQKLEFMARATQLPATNLGLIQIPYFGRKIKLAGDRTFDPWSVTIMNDEDFTIRDSMEAWNMSINTMEGNLRTQIGAENLYKSDAYITQYSKDGHAIRQYTFKGIFPETVSTIDLDWNANDQIEEFQVQFQYDYFTVEAISGARRAPEYNI